MTEFLHVAQVDVTGFAFHVLVGLAAAYGRIELRTTVAGNSDDCCLQYEVTTMLATLDKVPMLLRQVKASCCKVIPRLR